MVWGVYFGVWGVAVGVGVGVKKSDDNNIFRKKIKKIKKINKIFLIKFF